MKNTNHCWYLLFTLLFFFSASTYADLRVASFNMNGRTEKIPDFKKFLSGEEVVVLQEVNDIQKTRDQYSDYPYVYTTTNSTTASSFNVKTTSIMVLSKVPFKSTYSELIQTDPAVDKWERNAQHVVLNVGDGNTINLFHYHNTFNFHENGSQWERTGMRKFATWVKKRLNISDFSSARNVILTGDFNVYRHHAAQDLTSLECSNVWVDYVCSSIQFLAQGNYDSGEPISDHKAVWATLDTTLNIPNAVGPKVRIFNKQQGEYLYAADFSPFDADRRRVFTWIPGTPVTSGEWRLENIGNGTVRLFNIHQQEYLYAADFAPYDQDRRRVFTWRPGHAPVQGQWKIENIANGEVRILNTHQNEYLYAADFQPFDRDRRRVFTWRPGTPVNQGAWIIEYIN